ncbi:hypothetical protein K488DRAFT_22589, partial [Vararia minispora EC-137]
CSHESMSGRMPDLTRHIAAHDHDNARSAFVCLGEPELDTNGRPTGRRVRACYSAFSRRDALGRHLKKAKGMSTG